MHWYTLIPPVSEIPQEVPLEILLDRVTIYRRVAELGVQISEELASHDLCVMPVMNVGMFFSAALEREIHLPLIIKPIKASSYGDNTTSEGRVQGPCLDL